jgi:hypothetical protein
MDSYCCLGYNMREYKAGRLLLIIQEWGRVYYSGLFFFRLNKSVVCYMKF